MYGEKFELEPNQVTRLTLNFQSVAPKIGALGSALAEEDAMSMARHSSKLSGWESRAVEYAVAGGAWDLELLRPRAAP